MSFSTYFEELLSSIVSLFKSMSSILRAYILPLLILVGSFENNALKSVFFGTTIVY